MASASDLDDSSESITGINVTPLVDVVLVLLVVLMVTASYVASRAIPLELPRSATGESTGGVLAISVDKSGALYLDGALVDDATFTLRVRGVAKTSQAPRALIAADGAVPHRRVVRVIDLLRREGVTHLGFNVRPEELL